MALTWLSPTQLLGSLLSQELDSGEHLLTFWHQRLDHLKRRLLYFSGTGEMAPSVKYLLCKGEDLS